MCKIKSYSPEKSSSFPCPVSLPSHSQRPLGHRELPDPMTYRHPYDSMARFAKLLALRHNCNRTRHAYYRQLRLLQEHFSCDPKLIVQDQVERRGRRHG